MSDPYAYRSFKPLSDKLSVTEGTETNRTTKPCIRKPGMTAGMATDTTLRHQKVKKVLRKGQKQETSVGFEPGSEAEEAWIEEQENPGIEGLTGQEKHFLSMLQNDDLCDNCF